MNNTNKSEAKLVEPCRIPDGILKGSNLKMFKLDNLLSVFYVLS